MWSFTQIKYFCKVDENFRGWTVLTFISTMITPDFNFNARLVLDFTLILCLAQESNGPYPCSSVCPLLSVFWSAKLINCGRLLCGDNWADYWLFIALTRFQNALVDQKLYTSKVLPQFSINDQKWSFSENFIHVEVCATSHSSMVSTFTTILVGPGFDSHLRQINCGNFYHLLSEFGHIKLIVFKYLR